MYQERRQLSRADILREKIIPHGPRFMFLENAEIIESGKKARGKLVDRNRPEFDYLKDHFLGNPVFPGALLMETLAELSGIAATFGSPGNENKVGVLRKDEMEYKQGIRPEDEVDLEVEIIFFRMNTGRARVKAYITNKDGIIAAEGIITFMMIDKASGKELFHNDKA